MKPSCLTLNVGGTASTTLVITTVAVTQPGSYTVTVFASFQVSPSGWVTGRGATLLVTVVRDVYLVPAVLTVMVMIAAVIGGVAATVLVGPKAIFGRTRESVQR